MHRANTLTTYARGQNINVAIVGTRANALTRCWASAVGVPGGAGADELCKSVEVHSSDSGDMAQSLTIAKLQHWERSFRTGACGHCRLGDVLIGSAHHRTCAAHHRRSCTPQNSGFKLYHASLDNTHPLRFTDPTTRKPRRRAERMLPMASDYVRVPSSASIWAADLHRRVCEWEVGRLSVAMLRTVAITSLAVCLDVTATTALTAPIFITSTTTVHCRSRCRYHLMVTRTASLRMCRTAAVLLCPVSLLLFLSHYALSTLKSALSACPPAVPACQFLHCLLVVAMPALLGRWLSMSSDSGPIACFGSEPGPPARDLTSAWPITNNRPSGRCICRGTCLL
jgi:hypothetical protein